MKPKSKLIIDFVNDGFKNPMPCTIILDGKTLGDIDSDERKEFDIAPGKHSLFIARKKYNSFEHKFEAKPNKQVYLEIRFEPVEPYPAKFVVVQENFIEPFQPDAEEKPDP